jgi:hypothetical protein
MGRATDPENTDIAKKIVDRVFQRVYYNETSVNPSNIRQFLKEFLGKPELSNLNNNF